MRIKEDPPSYLEHRKRLKEKFRRSGLSALHDYEALELLLLFSIPRKDVKPQAKQLLQTFRSLKGVFDAAPEEIEGIKGIGSHTSLLIALLKDLCSVYLQEKAMEKPQISCTAELLQYCRMVFGGLKDERFCAIFLNAKNRVIAVDTIQEGIVNQAVVYPRKVLERALERKASAVILVHNHPSGETRPSDADIGLTKTIQEAATILDILVHDHLIVGGDHVFSFREEGLIR